MIREKSYCACKLLTAFIAVGQDIGNSQCYIVQVMNRVTVHNCIQAHILTISNVQRPEIRFKNLVRDVCLFQNHESVNVKASWLV